MFLFIAEGYGYLSFIDVATIDIPITLGSLKIKYEFQDRVWVMFNLHSKRNSNQTITFIVKERLFWCLN